MTEEKTARLRRVQQELRAQGKSTRAAGEERALQALLWLYRWGWSSPSVIDALSGAKRRGLFSKLERVKLVQSIKTEAGPIARNQSRIATLTRAGLEEVYRIISELHDYTTDPYRINQSTLRHDITVQRLTLQNLHAGRISGFTTPAEMAERGRELKRPDAVWKMPDRRSFMLELELSAKFARRLDEFVNGVLDAIAPDAGIYDGAVILSDSPALLARYTAAFKPGAAVQEWKKNSSNRWYVTGSYPVPGWADGRVLFGAHDAYLAPAPIRVVEGL